MPAPLGKFTCRVTLDGAHTSHVAEARKVWSRLFVRINATLT